MYLCKMLSYLQQTQKIRSYKNIDEGDIKLNFLF